MKNLAKERIGQIKQNNFGSLMEITGYKDNKNIIVKFLNTGNYVTAQYDNFLKGQVSNPLDKTVYGVGYIGEGYYKPSNNGKDSLQYSTWHSMMLRCYDQKFKEKNPTYRECAVCDEWHNFQNFAKWYDLNYYQVDDEKMSLDKDILIKGNKIYSPTTCVFIPQRLNTLFIKRDSRRGQLPLGVTFHKKNKKYMAKENNINYIGCYDNPIDAFQAYKQFKENLIKQIVKEYNQKIPDVLYNAILNYKVEITD